MFSNETSYAHHFYDLESEMFLHHRELKLNRSFPFDLLIILKENYLFVGLAGDLCKWENTISGNRFRLHVVIPESFDYADAGARKQVEELLSNIRNSSFVSDNATELEENWMEKFQMWNGGMDDW